MFFKPLLFASSIAIRIAGASGAGKTTLATKMMKQFLFLGNSSIEL